jgi:hypothetical protein
MLTGWPSNFTPSTQSLLPSLTNSTLQNSTLAAGNCKLQLQKGCRSRNRNARILALKLPRFFATASPAVAARVALPNARYRDISPSNPLTSVSCEEPASSTGRCSLMATMLSRKESLLPSLGRSWALCIVSEGGMSCDVDTAAKGGKGVFDLVYFCFRSGL